MGPIRHHYIPVFYLKRWVNRPHPWLCEFSRQRDLVLPRRTAPAGTGYVDRLYALRGFPEHLAHQVEEKFFRAVDSSAADALRVLEGGGSTPRLTVAQRSAWSRFLVSLLSRTPEDLIACREVWPKHISYVSDDAERDYAARRRPEDAATLRELMSSIPSAEAERFMLEGFINLMDNPSLGAKLNALPFRVIVFPETAPELMTSDRPVIRNHMGLGARGGHLALPIGPRRLFVCAADPALLDGLANANRSNLARECNRIVTRHAVRLVFARTDQNLGFVRKHFAATVEPRLIHARMTDRIRERERDRRISQEKPREDQHALLATNLKSKTGV